MSSDNSSFITVQVDQPTYEQIEFLAKQTNTSIVEMARICWLTMRKLRLD